jgi:hypothetical protein
MEGQQEMVDVDEVARREKAARAAIRKTFGTTEGEYGADLFVSHHLEELDNQYWRTHVGTEQPNGGQVLDILQFKSHWSGDDDDGLEIFDFTLPDDVTNYVLSVRFDDTGMVEDISMES